MSNAIQRDEKRRVLVSKLERRRIEYKYLINDNSIPREKRFNFVKKLSKLPRNSSVTRVRNRCVLTGRGHGIFRICRLSRIKFRELAASGFLPGFSKASW